MFSRKLGVRWKVQTGEQIENRTPQIPLKRCCMTQRETRKISYLQSLLRTTGWRFESSPVHHLFQKQ